MIEYVLARYVADASPEKGRVPGGPGMGRKFSFKQWSVVVIP